MTLLLLSQLSTPKEELVIVPASTASWGMSATQHCGTCAKVSMSAAGNAVAEFPCTPRWL